MAGFGLNVGPSGGFLGKMGMGLNAGAQAFGGPTFSRAARMTGGMYDQRRKVDNSAGGGVNTPGQQTQTQNGPSGMHPQGPTPFDPSSPNPSPNTGMVRPPSFMFNPGMRIPNTGITGGMFPGMGGGVMRPQVMPPMAMTGMPGGGPMTSGMGGGDSSTPSPLWQTYSGMAAQPQRQLMY